MTHSECDECGQKLQSGHIRVTELRVRGFQAIRWEFCDHCNSEFYSEATAQLQRQAAARKQRAKRGGV